MATPNDTTDNHGYQLWADAAADWEHRSDFEALDIDVEIRDLNANRGNYTAKQDAKFVATDTGDVYRFDDDRPTPCVCQVVESHGIPVADAHADDGQLHVTFHATDVDAGREVVDALRERHGAVSVRRLWQSGRASAEDLAFVDRSRLTDRQAEVLATAYRLGYFDRPRGASGGDVADALDISPSTFAEHLATAQRKVLADVLDE